ncbi:MAG TPA: YbhB/YbcL family Raf kinase inhibitor-like protein [Candidatus Paceibacterota bacterium]
MKITTGAFEDGGNIPSRFTCDGENANPELSFEDVPAAAKSLALVMDDPDAPMGTFVHWILWNIPPDTKKILEKSSPAGAMPGANSMKRAGYIGPCPPSGTHHYHFKLYALDAVLDLPDSSGKSALESAMNGHIIEQTELIGLYSRQR